MEIPPELKSLYNHWQKHTLRPKPSVNEFDQTKLKDIEAFATERMLVWERKQEELSELTKDPILKSYRFCNIYRELDKQTILLHKKIQHLTKEPELWFLNALFFRLIARPETIDVIGLLSFDEKNNKAVMSKLLSSPSPKYGVPYVFPISAIQRSAWPTRESFFCLYLPIVAKQCADYLLSGNNRSVAEVVDELKKLFGFNLKFHLTEVVIDFAYQYPEKINLFDLFPIGPGSLPTMKSLSLRQDPEKTCLSLAQYQPKTFPYLTLNGKPIYLSAENWEGIGCEYRKYTNLKNGVGRKRRYIK